MNRKLVEKLKTYRLPLIMLVVAVALVVVLVVLNIGGSSQPSNPQDNMPMEYDEAEVAETESTASENAPILFENLTFLSDFVGHENYSDLLEVLRDAVLPYLEDDRASYAASVAGRNLQFGISFPYDTCSFLLEVSDGSVYQVRIALLEGKYYGLLLGQYPEDPADAPEFYIAFLKNTREGAYDRDAAISELLAWAETLTPLPLTVTTRDLYLK